MQEEKVQEEQADKKEQEAQTEEPKPKLNRKQRRALNSKRGGASDGSAQDSDKKHTNRIEPKPKARRR